MGPLERTPEGLPGLRDIIHERPVKGEVRRYSETVRSYLGVSRKMELPGRLTNHVPRVINEQLTYLHNVSLNVRGFLKVWTTRKRDTLQDPRNTTKSLRVPPIRLTGLHESFNPRTIIGST